MQQFVRLIKLIDVVALAEVVYTIRQRYPNARIRLVTEERGVVQIAIPDLLWNTSPNGPEVFFRGLCRSGWISGFHHKRYSDQEEVRY